ncbi:MAG TPA: non-homologous end-joining DNA ligase [Polyangiaceae bacterium]|nr:non-homologous end-joining DNA ligase [Polyangiaceae bacterium]
MPVASLARHRSQRDGGRRSESKDAESKRQARAKTKAPFPAHTEIQLATLVDAVPVGDEWVHEIKLDGYRLIAELRSGGVKLKTRGDQDWTARFPRLVEALEGIDVETAIFDGEVVVLDEHGVSDFQLLQNALSAGARQSPHYFVFDLLYLDGHDLRQLPLVERKKRLRVVLGPSTKSKSAIHYCDHVIGRGEVFYTQACELGLEGVVSKRGDRPHFAGRTREWVKTKCSRQQEFVIGGYTDPAGSRQNLGALLLGVHENGRLVYAGKVGTGFSQASLAQIHQRLEPLGRDDSPFDDVPRADQRGVHWVKPALVAEVRFTSFTQDGRLRHPTFRGLRDDKRPEEVIRERAVP